MAIIRFPQPKAYELAPAGSHLAACFSIVDLGSQPYNYAGDTGIRRQIRLAFEYLDEFMNDGRPYSVSRMYGFSMHPNSTFCGHLEGWLGRRFSDDDVRNFNLADQLGAVAVVSVMHAPGSNGATYANLQQLLQPPAGVPRRHKLVNAPLALSPDDFDKESYQTLPEWLKKKVDTAPEYQRVLKGGGLSTEQLAFRLQQKLEASVAAKEATKVNDLEDEIPF